VVLLPVLVPGLAGAGGRGRGRRRDGLLDRLWQDWSPGYDAAEDLARAKESLRHPANLTAAISYYRDPVPGAVVPYAAEEQAASRQARQPTLYLHGSVDGCITVELVRGAERHLAPGSRMLVVEGAGHFPHLERPEEVNEQILAWATG
jgi:pimeloyl-ACP methyl ester carboxylesterase